MGERPAAIRFPKGVDMIRQSDEDPELEFTRNLEPTCDASGLGSQRSGGGAFSGTLGDTRSDPLNDTLELARKPDGPAGRPGHQGAFKGTLGP
jgi:hypothetical protein